MVLFLSCEDIVIVSMVMLEDSLGMRDNSVSVSLLGGHITYLAGRTSWLL